MRGPGGWCSVGAVLGSILLGACGSATGPGSGGGGGSEIPAYDGNWHAVVFSFTRAAAPHDVADYMGPPWHVEYSMAIDSAAATVREKVVINGGTPIVTPAPGFPVRIAGDTIWLAQGGRPESIWWVRQGSHLVWHLAGLMPDGTGDSAGVRVEVAHY